MVTENGAAVAIPPAAGGSEWQIDATGQTMHIGVVIHTVCQQRAAGFAGFGDWDVDGVMAAHTGLPTACNMPGAGLEARSNDGNLTFSVETSGGGRWPAQSPVGVLHVMGRFDKADGMRADAPRRCHNQSNNASSVVALMR